jgi:hypothetical protein
MSNKFKPNGRKFRDAKREVMAEFVRAYFAEQRLRASRSQRAADGRP